MIKASQKTQLLVFIRPAVDGEKIEVYTSDGKETDCYGHTGEFVVRNATSALNEYIIRADKISRYEESNESIDCPADLPENYKLYRAKGEIRGLLVNCNNFGLPDPFYFIAPWGEAMICRDGDVLARPEGENEIYRITQVEFNETYMEK